MKIKYRSLLSVMAAVGIAAGSIAANNASAETVTRNLDWVAPDNGQANQVFKTDFATYQNRQPGTGFDLGQAAYVRNYQSQWGTDTLVGLATGGSSSTVPNRFVPVAQWNCRGRLWFFGTNVKNTNFTTGSRATASSGFVQGTTQPYWNFPRVLVTTVQAECQY